MKNVHPYLNSMYRLFFIAALFSLTNNIQSQDVYCTNVDFTFTEAGAGVVEFTSTADKPVKEWYWYFGDQQTGREQDIQNTYTYAGEYDVCLKVVTIENCTGAICKKIRVSTGAVGAACNLNVDFKFEVQNNLLIAKGWSTANSASRYFWTFGDNKTGEGSEVKHQYENKGEYEVCLIVSQPLSNTAGSVCTERICKKVIIQQANTSDCGLEVDIKYEISGNKLIAKAISNGGNAAKYTWTFGDGTSGDGTVVNHQYVIKGDYELCLTVTKPATSANLLCTKTVCKKVQIVGSNTSDCGLEVDIKYELTGNKLVARAVSNAGDGARYSWKFGDGATGDGIEVKHEYTTKGDYQLCLTVTKPATSANQLCSKTVCKKVQIIGSNTSDCGLEADIKYEIVGQKLIARAISNGGNTAKYSWKFGDGNSGDGISITHEYAARGTYELCLTVTKSTTIANQLCSKTVCKKIQIGQTNTSDCDLEVDIKYEINGNILVARAVSNGGNGAKYSWKFGDGTSGDGIGVKHEYLASGNYELCLTVTKPTISTNQLCTKTVCKRIEVGVKTNADCDLMVDFKYLTTNSGITLQGRSNDPNATYHWTISGVDSKYTGKDVRVPLTTAGVYTVCLIVVNGDQDCREQVCKRIVIGRTNRLYPNPTVDQLQISSEETITAYNITNRFSTQIQSGSLYSAGEKIDVSALPSGMYLLTLYYEDGSSSIEKFYKN